jgi:hypothetical protein
MVTSTFLGKRCVTALLPGLLMLTGLACAETSPAQHQHEAAVAKMRPERPQFGTSAAFAADGALLAVTRQGEHVMLYRSDDLGKTWSAPVAVNAAPEPILADGENRPKLLSLPGGSVVVSWARRLGRQFTGEVRLARSTDGGRSFAPPITIHRDRQEIGHSFETLLTDTQGRIYAFWLDKRDGEAAKTARQAYRGSAVYAAVSDNDGRSFRHEARVADHSCECCRIAAAPDTDGTPVILWRHVFEPNLRDHAIAKIAPDGTPRSVERATFDGWRVDGCPHHGPSLAITPDGTRHAVWFNQKDGAGRVFYGRLQPGRVEGQRFVGGERAAHADLAVSRQRIAIVWKEFDGERTRLMAELSDDGGETFRSMTIATTEKISDQPRVLLRGEELFAFWRTELEGMRAFPLR